ncbi:MAG TPA: hypothetical protein VHN18_09425 [Micromonosporaceae bacterium]|nr:hypothetical protein [Micromonosporaceae bacterium]
MAQIRVGIRCDARPSTGVGHLIRCVALAEEFQARNVDVTFLGEVSDDLPWAGQQLASRGLRRVPAPATPDGLAQTARRLGLHALVADAYDLASDYTAACRASGLVVASIVDGDLRCLRARCGSPACGTSCCAIRYVGSGPPSPGRRGGTARGCSASSAAPTRSTPRRCSLRC